MIRKYFLSLCACTRALICLFAVLLALSATARAEGQLLAQADDSYDPFADFSEFEDSAQEEADINFFLNGRFITLGFLVGYRGWSGNYPTIYGGGPTFGLHLSYFFDLRFAMQVSFISTDAAAKIPNGDGVFIDGNVSTSAFGFDFKYYLNTQNVTKGVAALNPYLLMGFSHNANTVTVISSEEYVKDGSLSFDAGFGLEIPMMRNKMYFGMQAVYHLVNFSDENSDLNGFTPQGDTYTGLGILGVNF